MSRWQSLKSNASSLYSAAKSSYQQAGKFSNGLPLGTKLTGSFAREGVLHAVKRGVADMFGVGGQYGMIRTGSVLTPQFKRYGGHLFSRGGLREIRYDKELGPDGLYRLGAKRSWGKMLGKFAGKAIWPAMFLYTASQEGMWNATKETAISGAAWGGATWLAKSALVNPLTVGLAATAGLGYGAYRGLKAGREYYRNSQRINFGNPVQDTYGTVATMRQAAVQAINSSKINGRSALGFEASLLHN